MPRYALKVEYHGGPFVGWQRQTELPSVQGNIEQALSILEPGDHTIVAAGRTDAGVHAVGQVAHCDLVTDWTPFRLSEALNFHLKPSPISIVSCAKVDEDWHARFSAVERKYEFRIVCRRAPLIHENGLVWHVKHHLDVKAMQRGANYLLGNHDFTTFRSSICQATSPVKTLDELLVTEIPINNGTEIRFTIRARSFLHNQVRSFVGTLERVGAGAWSPEDVLQALSAKNRTACGPVSPPYGLYLSSVRYPIEPFI